MKRLICILVISLFGMLLPLTNVSASTEEELILNSSLEDDSNNLLATDPSKPIIKGYDITTGNDICLTQEQLKSQFTYSDDTTLVENIRFEIRADAYTPGYRTVGKYKVTGKVWDEDNNSSSTSFYVTVIDKIKPVIYLDESFNTTVPEENDVEVNTNYETESYKMSIKSKRKENIIQELLNFILDSFNLTEKEIYQKSNFVSLKGCNHVR